MAGAALQSAGRRWLRKLGFALVQAAAVSAFFGALAYFRAGHEREDEDASPSPLKGLRKQAEALELMTFDWRAQELGDASDPSDDVVIVAIDDQTLANARESDRQQVALQPWPRELTGGIVDELAKEGASLVVLDLLFPDLSARACPSAAPGSPASAGNEALLLEDDWRFRSELDAVPGRSLLTYSWSDAAAKAPVRELTPFGVRVASPPSLSDELPLVGRILSDRKRLFSIPDGRRVQLWAGAASEEEASQLAQLWHVRGTPEIRALTPADLERPVTSRDVLVLLSEVQVEGLDPSQLMEVGELHPPIAALLASSSRYGSVTVPADLDGTIRAFPHLVAYRARGGGPRRDGQLHVLPSAPLAAAMRIAGDATLRYRDGKLEVGQKFSIPMDPGGMSLIRWEAGRLQGSQGTLKRAVSAWDVLQNMWDAAEEQPRHTDNRLQGRVAVLTQTSSLGRNLRATPLGRTPAGAVMGQALANILHSDGIRRASPDLDLTLVATLAFFGAVLALALSGVLRSGGGALLYVFSAAMAVVAYWLAARYIFIHQHVWIAVALPVLGLLSTYVLSVVHAFRTEAQVKDFIQSVLGRYVSPEVARQVTGDLTLIRAERRRVTVLFSDIEGFTPLSEKLPAERLVQLLNEYFTEMTATIRRNGGQVDKYIGDSIMAFWGAPVRTELHAQLACDSALAMRLALFRRQEEWEQRFGHRLRFRVGIHTGEGVVGDMGSDLKSNYTVMGDPVDFASFLEGANKAFGTSILVGEATVQGGGRDYAFRELDRIRLKGHAEPLRVYELMGRVDAVPPGRARQIEPFARALDAYRRQRFSEARSLFEDCRRLDDPVAGPYLARCLQYLEVPPPEDWDGVFVPGPKA